MITRVLKKLFGSRNDRLLRRYRTTVARINELEPSVAALSDEALRAKTGYHVWLSSAGPEMMSGVRASSMRMESTSSTIAK